MLAVLTSLLAAALPWQPTELVLERSKRQLRVIQNGRQIARYSVAVGRASNPTPLGNPPGASAGEGSDLEQPLAQTAGGGVSHRAAGNPLDWILVSLR